MSRNIEINIKTQDESTQQTQYEVLYPKNTAKNVLFNSDGSDNVTVYDKLNNITPNNSFELGDILLTSKINVDTEKWALCDGGGLNPIDYDELSNIMPVSKGNKNITYLSLIEYFKSHDGVYVGVSATDSTFLNAFVTKNPLVDNWTKVSISNSMTEVTGLNYFNNTWWVFANNEIYKTQDPFGTWESISTNLGGSYICDMAYYDGVYVGVGYAGSGWDSWVGYSTDLTTWTTKYLISPSTVSNLKPHMITVNNGIFVCVLNGNKVFKTFTPMDNNSWIQVYVDNSSSDRYGGGITGIIYYDGKYIMSNYTNTKAIIYSTNDDFTTWGELTLNTGINFLAKDEYDNKFYGLYDNSSSGAEDSLYVSENPITHWEENKVTFEDFIIGLQVYKKVILVINKSTSKGYIGYDNLIILPDLSANKSKYYIKVKN